MCANNRPRSSDAAATCAVNAVTICATNITLVGHCFLSHTDASVPCCVVACSSCVRSRSHAADPTCRSLPRLPRNLRSLRHKQTQIDSSSATRTPCTDQYYLACSFTRAACISLSWRRRSTWLHCVSRSVAAVSVTRVCSTSAFSLSCRASACIHTI